MTATQKAKLAEILASLSNTMKSTLRLHDNCARPVIRDLGFPKPGSRLAVLKIPQVIVFTEPARRKHSFVFERNEFAKNSFPSWN